MPRAGFPCPRHFASVLAERGIQELYCFQDFVFPAISIGGPDLLDRYERQIAAEDPFSPEANEMSLLIHGGGVFMKLDAEGRLMVTDFIRDFTGITDEVTFVGRADHFQLWQPAGISGGCRPQARGERRLAGGRSGVERGNGMAANSGEGDTDAGGGPVRHIPVLLPEVLRRSRRRRARSFSMALSAPAAIPRRSLKRVRTSSRSIAIRPRSQPARRWSRRMRGRLTLIHSQFSQPCRSCA